MYGEDPVTLSDSMITLPCEGVILASIGADDKRYVNFLSLVIPVITLLPLYSSEEIPLIRTESSTFKLWAIGVSTLAITPLVVILSILKASDDRSPTI